MNVSSHKLRWLELLKLLSWEWFTDSNLITEHSCYLHELLPFVEAP